MANKYRSLIAAIGYHQSNIGFPKEALKSSSNGALALLTTIITAKVNIYEREGHFLLEKSKTCPGYYVPQVFGSCPLLKSSLDVEC